MRRRRGFRLTDVQAQILMTVIIIMMVVIAIQSAYIIYLKISKSRVKFEIKELPPPKAEGVLPPATDVESTETSTPVSTTPEPTPQVYEVETFDYQKLLDEATVFVIPPPVSVFVVSGKDALRIIRSSGKDFIISEIGDGRYTVMVKGNVEINGLMSQKDAYGISVAAYYSENPALDKVMALKQRGFCSYVFKSKDSKGRNMYTTVLGLFPNRETALKFMEKHWNEVREITGVRADRGYVFPVIR